MELTQFRPALGAEPLRVDDLIELRPIGGKPKQGVVISVDAEGNATVRWTPETIS